LEGGTKEEIRISNEALFKGVSTRFGLRTIEKYIENLDFLFCSSFQNLRLGSIESWEGRTNISECGLEALFKGVNAGFGLGLQNVETCLDEQSGCNFMLPKRRFWKEKQNMNSGLSTDFSKVRVPN
jgi:hypothetical protein